MTQRILVVEDDAAVRAMLTDVLRDAGYAVEAVATIEGGFAAVQRVRPDLIVCDLIVPPDTGRDLYDWLARYPAYATIPLLFLTALPPILADERLIGDLVDVPVLYKPIQIDDLLRAVTQILVPPAL